MKKLAWNLLNKIGIGGAIQLHLSGGLKEDGWFKSFVTKQSIDRNSNPIPWYNYTVIKFIESRLNKDLQVFEFGAGNSTLWYAQRAKSVKSVENDKAWVNMLQPRLPRNVELVYRTLENGEYANEIKRDGKKYDVVIVDGRRRNDCVMASVDSLQEDGIMILDNSDREDYQPAKDFLASKGFKNLDFTGIPPIIPHNTCTSIFYRTSNCFGI